MALGLLFFVLFNVWPEQEQQKEFIRKEDRKKLWAFCIYLAAFATHFGAQIWMTFVSGKNINHNNNTFKFYLDFFLNRLSL